MLGNVKSSFIAKKILLLLHEKIKLKLIKYNKSFQNKVGVNLINYKFFKHKYIIYEEGRTKGKEYNDKDQLIYEGEYLNGVRNGKGKEYTNRGNLIFEGEFLNGKKWNGNGRQGDHSSYLVYKFIEGNAYFDVTIDNKQFQGNYLNGEKNGEGKEYNRVSGFCMIISIFEGEYLNGKKWNGTEHDQKGNIFYELKNGKGYAKEFYSEGRIIYEGEYLNGEKNGKGKEYDTEGKLIFEGDYLCNHKKRGKEFVKGKLEYEGEYLYGTKFNGKGYDENGNIIYELKNGNGKAREYKNNILIFKGEYLNGERSGKGKEYGIYGCMYQDIYKLIFKGEYLNGKRWNGKGKEINSYQNLTFIGQYLNGKNGMDN